MKFIKKPVSILLIMTMIVSLFTIIPFEASAAETKITLCIDVGRDVWYVSSPMTKQQRN